MTTTRRVRSADEALALLEPEEPSSTLLVAELRERGIGRRVRTWIAEEDGESVGALVVSRICLDRWQAFPFLFDPAAAKPIGELIDKSPAFIVGGPLHHVEPLVPYVRRRRGLVSMPCGGGRARPGIASATERIELVDDDRTRLATLDDLDDLVELFNGYELDHIPTVPRLRRFLREFLEIGRPIIVVEQDGKIVGASRYDAKTEHFLYLGAQTILPEYRGQHLSHVLGSRSVTYSVEHGLGGFSVRSNRNPVPMRTDPVDREQYREYADPLVDEEYDTFLGTWSELTLNPRRHIRGIGRVRQLIERIEGPVRRRPPPEPYPERTETAADQS